MDPLSPEPALLGPLARLSNAPCAPLLALGAAPDGGSLLIVIPAAALLRPSHVGNIPRAPNQGG